MIEMPPFIYKENFRLTPSFLPFFRKGPHSLLEIQFSSLSLVSIIIILYYYYYNKDKLQSIFVMENILQLLVYK